MNIPEQTSTAALETYFASRSRRTSADLGWGSLLVRSRVEPAVLKEHVLPGIPDPWLVLVTRGARRVAVRDRKGWRSGISRVGYVGITSPGRMTTIRWTSESPEPIETLHICLDAGLFRRFAADAADCDPASIEVVDRLAERDPLIEQVGLSLRRELWSPGAASRLLADAAAQLLVAHLLEHHCAVPIVAKPPRGGLTPAQLRRVRDYVDAHLASSITLEDLAAEAGVSLYHFARLFRHSTNESPHRYVVRMKIERARRLLAETDLPIAQVARACGFSSGGHFAGVFRKLTGATPAAYRRSCR